MDLAGWIYLFGRNVAVPDSSRMKGIESLKVLYEMTFGQKVSPWSPLAPFVTDKAVSLRF